MRQIGDVKSGRYLLQVGQAPPAGLERAVLGALACERRLEHPDPRTLWHRGLSSAGSPLLDIEVQMRPINTGRAALAADMTNQGRDEKMRLALVPPKPKEFVMAYLIGIGAVRCTIRFNALSASRVVRFMVGGAT